MPAERTRYSRRSQADGDAIVWTLPVEPKDESGIAFAPNLTEGAFSDLPPLVDAPPLSPSDSFIFSFEDGGAAGTTQRKTAVHTRKKSDNHIPRPPNAFILFRSSFIKSQRVSTEVETNHSTLSKIIGMTWKNLSDDERQIWRHKAMDAVAEHKRNFPLYAFRPKHSRVAKKGAGSSSATDSEPMQQPKSKKRKVREVYQDPRRCEKIAELLVEGKKGAELDRAIQEFDRHHVPQIVTRFEAPITARTYRRSSSVPAPSSDDAHSGGFLQAVASATGSSSSVHRRRSSSVGAASTRSSQEQFQRTRASSVAFNAAPPPSPFDSASFSFPKQEDDADPFDFSSFSFSNLSSPAPSFGCDPLCPVSPTSPLAMSFDDADLAKSFNDTADMSSPASPTYDDAISAFIASEWSHAQQVGEHDKWAVPQQQQHQFPAAAYPALYAQFDFTGMAPQYAVVGAPPAYTACDDMWKNTSCDIWKTGVDACGAWKTSCGPDAWKMAAPGVFEPEHGQGQDAHAQYQLAQLEADLSAFMAQYSL